MIGLTFAASTGRRRAAHGLFSKLIAAASAALPVTMLASITSLIVSIDAAQAKGPGRTYCFYKTCHRVKTIAETQSLIGRDMTLTASFYDSCKKDKFNPCGLTSSGERFRPERADNAASPILPDGTVALVWSETTREAVVLRINNAGPYWGDRKLDLSRAAAQKLGVKGVGKVKLRVLKAPTDAEARYVKNRVYDPVPGAIGNFASLDAAHGAMSVMVAMGLPSTKGLNGAPAIALAANGAVESADPASDLTVAFKTPIVPRFDVLEDGFKSALVAQADVERQLRGTARLAAGLAAAAPVALTREASIDARPITATAKPVAAPRTVTAVAPPSRSIPSEPLAGKTIRTADAVPETTESTKAASSPAPVRAKAKARRVRAAVETPKSSRRAAERVAQVKTQAAHTVARQTQVSKPSTRMRSARARHEAETGEIKVGFTTYAEARYRQPAKSTVPGKGTHKKSAKGGSKLAPPAATAVAAGKPGPAATKRAQLPKSQGRSAALKKAGGWQSSALMETPHGFPGGPSPVRIMGPVPRIPAGDLHDERDSPPRPLMRTQPSALV